MFFVLISIFGYRLLNLPTGRVSENEKIVEIELVKHALIKKSMNVIGTIRSGKKTVLTAKSKGVLEHLNLDSSLKKEVFVKIENKDIEKL